ncbi:MAG: hypothetical protein PUD59_05855 [bacterium]|nr:hypothetical protein [bacterium]
MNLENYNSLKNYLLDEIELTNNEIRKLEEKKNKYIKRLNDCNKKIIEASIFDTYAISECIKYIMSEVEGKNICCAKVNLPEIFEVFSGNNIIIGESEAVFSKKQNSADVLDPHRTILLSSTGDKPFPKQIQFLEYVQGSIQPAVYLGGFPYIDNFINEVIEYRYINNIKELSFEDIMNKAKEFISEYKKNKQK